MSTADASPWYAFITRIVIFVFRRQHIRVFQPSSWKAALPQPVNFLMSALRVSRQLETDTSNLAESGRSIQLFRQETPDEENISKKNRGTHEKVGGTANM